MPAQTPLGRNVVAASESAGRDRASSPIRAALHSIEIHPTECALVLKFASANSESQASLSSPATKVIRLRPPLPSADELAEKLKVQSSWIAPLQTRLNALSARLSSSPKTPQQSRSQSGSLGCFSSLGSLGILSAEPEAAGSKAWESDFRVTPGSRSRPTSSYLEEDGENDFSGDDICDESSTSDQAVVPPEVLEQHIELLYEDSAAKLKCVNFLKSISKSKANVEYFAENAPLLAALARTLREDAKGSPKLAAGILSVIERIAMNPSHHSALSVQKIGDICLKILALETRRCDFWFTHPPKSAATVAVQALLLQRCMRVLFLLSQSKSAKKKLATRQAVSTVLEVTAARCEVEVNLSPEGQKNSASAAARPQSSATHAYERAKKLSLATMRYIRDVVAFLTPLSHYVPFVAEIRAKPQLLTPLFALFATAQSGNGSNGALGNDLKVLINLAHDVEIQRSLVSCGLLSLVVDLIQSEDAPLEAYVLLYLFSTDEKHNSIMSYSELPKLVSQKILKVKDSYASVELMALAINLAMNEKSAETIAADGVVTKLWSRAASRMDYLFLKLLRNLAMHEELMDGFKPHISEIWTALSNATSTSHQVELLGILHYLTRHMAGNSGQSSEVVKIVETQVSVVSALADSLKRLSSAENAGRSADDDILLEAVLVVNAICLHPRGAATICTALGAKLLVDTVIGIMKQREDDEALLAAAISCFNSVLGGAPAFRARCAEVANLTPMMSSFLASPSLVIRTAAESAFATLSGCNELHSVAEEIKKSKFQARFARWLSTGFSERHKANSGSPQPSLESRLRSQSPRGAASRALNAKASQDNLAQSSELFRTVKLF